MVIKRHSFGSALYYLNGRPATMSRYLSTFYPPYDWQLIRSFFYKNPIQAKVILADFAKTNDAKFNQVVNMFVYGKSKIVYIVGARDSGKTATAFKFAESVYMAIQRPIYYIAPTINKNILPEWCRHVEDVRKAPSGCIALIDEAALQYNAREFMQEENIDLTKLLAIARHKDMFVIFLTQDTALADKNIRRLRDIVIWKMSNDYSLNEQGTKNSPEHRFWQKVRNMMAPRSKPECLFEFPAQRRFIHFTHGLADCWSDNLSKLWKDFGFNKDNKKEVKKTVKKTVLKM